MHSQRSDTLAAVGRETDVLALDDIETAVTARETGAAHRFGRRRQLGDAAYLVLVTTGWFVGNVLGILGCAVVFFIILGAGQWDAFFLQIDNLASRYVAADHGRRWMFEHYLVQTFMVLLIGSTLLRAPGFVRRVRRELAQEPGK